MNNTDHNPDHNPGHTPDLESESAPREAKNLDLGLDTADDGQGEGESRRSYTRRQLGAMSLAFMILGVGLGMAFTTATFVRDTQSRNRPTNVDLGFVRDMLDHHDQAVEMSLIALQRPNISATVEKFATEVVIFQRYEIGLMEGRLNVWAEQRGDPDRLAMAWMGMGTPVERMNGMATQADLDRLANATGVNADRLFLALMTEHHRGGVHMAEYTAAHARDDETIALAVRMARNQALEITEYQRALRAVPAS